MSQAGGPSGEVGRINVAFTGDASGAIAAANQAKAAFDETSAAAQAAAAKSVDSSKATADAVTTGAEAQAAAQDRVIGKNAEAAASSNASTTAVVDGSSKIVPAIDRSSNAFVSFGNSVKSTVAPVRNFVNSIRSIGSTITGVIAIFAFWAAAISGVIALLQKLSEAKIDKDLVERIETLSSQGSSGVAGSLESLKKESRPNLNVGVITKQLEALKEVQDKLSALQSELGVIVSPDDITGITRTVDAFGVRDPVKRGQEITRLRGDIQSLQADRARIAEEIAGPRNAARGQEQMVSEQKRTNIKLDRSVQRYIGFSY